MKLHAPSFSKKPAGLLHPAALAALIFSSTAFAAFEPLPPGTGESPGVALGSGTAGITGLVIDAQDSPFNQAPDFQGILRSLVVDTGLGYDFYYQIINTETSPGAGSDIFRVKTIGGFDGSTLLTTYRTDLTGLDFGSFATGPLGGAGAYTTGTKPIFSADRDEGSLGSVGFDFAASQFLFDPANIQAGQTSHLFVVRTDQSTYTTVNADVSGGGTARIPSFAPVPEPQSVALLAIGILFVMRRRSKRW